MVHDSPSLFAGFKYHAFIIYSSIDFDFVKNILIPTLERYGFKYCIHWKDFPPGEVFRKTIVKSVYNSFKIIAVVSQNFINSEPCQYEMDQAQHRLMTQRDDCLIVIKYDGVNVTEVLGDPLLQRSYIDFTSIWDRSRWESRLVQVLQKCVLEDESCDCSEGNANNNNLTQENSTGDGGQELFCSCQSAVWGRYWERNVDSEAEFGVLFHRIISDRHNLPFPKSTREDEDDTSRKFLSSRKTYSIGGRWRIGLSTCTNC